MTTRRRADGSINLLHYAVWSNKRLAGEDMAIDLTKMTQSELLQLVSA